MRIIFGITIILFAFFYSCRQSQSAVTSKTEEYSETDSDSLYLVTAIGKMKDSENNRDFIYVINVRRNDSIFTVLTKEEIVLPIDFKCNKIKVGNKYNLALKPLYTKAEISDRVNFPFFAMNYLDYQHPLIFKGVYLHVEWNYH